MTPQLQQAIRLLQLSALDLQQEIQNTLEENPMLELTDEAADGALDGDGSLDESASEISASSDSLAELEAEQANQDSAGLDEPHVADVNEQLAEPVGEDLPVDSNWDDIYPNASSLPETCFAQFATS